MGILLFLVVGGQFPRLSGPKLKGNKSCKYTLMNLEPSLLNIKMGNFGANSLMNCLQIPQGDMVSSVSPHIASTRNLLNPSLWFLLVRHIEGALKGSGEPWDSTYHCLRDGTSLGTYAGSVGSVFDVGAGECFTGRRYQCAPDPAALVSPVSFSSSRPDKWPLT